MKGPVKAMVAEALSRQPLPLSAAMKRSATNSTTTVNSGVVSTAGAVSATMGGGTACYLQLSCDMLPPIVWSMALTHCFLLNAALTIL